MTTKPTERDLIEEVEGLLAKYPQERVFAPTSKDLDAMPELLRRLVAEVKDLRAANISKLLSEIKDRLTLEEGEQFQSLLMAATRGWVTEVTERSEVDRGLLEVFKDMPKRKRRRR